MGFDRGLNQSPAPDFFRFRTEEGVSVSFYDPEGVEARSQSDLKLYADAENVIQLLFDLCRNGSDGEGHFEIMPGVLRNLLVRNGSIFNFAADSAAEVDVEEEHAANRDVDRFAPDCSGGLNRFTELYPGLDNVGIYEHFSNGLVAIMREWAISQVSNYCMEDLLAQFDRIREDEFFVYRVPFALMDKMGFDFILEVPYNLYSVIAIGFQIPSERIDQGLASEQAVSHMTEGDLNSIPRTILQSGYFTNLCSSIGTPVVYTLPIFGLLSNPSEKNFDPIVTRIVDYVRSLDSDQPVAEDKDFVKRMKMILAEAITMNGPN